MFERPQGGETAILVHLVIGRESDDNVAEFQELVVSAGVEPLALIAGSRAAPDPKFFVGKGKVEEIKLRVQETAAQVVIFDHELSPAQERNLEKEFQCRVLDRTGLILDIFAQHARSFEGKLQVELAQLKHLSTRLVRGWTHLERQKGGIGLRGPGETQLETDRRLLNARIKQINKRLEKVDKQRVQGRRARTRAAVPTITLVGYTNAGKSTLFNALTGASVYAADQMFATLDPTLRRVEIGDAGPVILADTVGFVRQLPHDLVVAFRSTLQETRESDLLLVVVDAADPKHEDQVAQVSKVLEEINAEDVPRIMVYNKIDLVEGLSPRAELGEAGKIARIWLSAEASSGLEFVAEALRQFFGQEFVQGWVDLPATEGRTHARLHELGVVLDEELDENGGWLMEIRVQRQTFHQMLPANTEIFEKHPHKSKHKLADHREQI